MSDADWQGEPEDTLGAVVPAQQLMARTSRAVIALQHAVAFRQGCLLVLQVAVRPGQSGQSAWDDVIEGTFSPGSGLTGIEDDLRYGVRLADGSRATTAEHPLPGWVPATDRPEPPMLVEAGAESSGGATGYRGSRHLWLWPLPPPEPFELVAEWPSAGVAAATARIDGGAIVRAAELAFPYWP